MESSLSASLTTGISQGKLDNTMQSRAYLLLALLLFPLLQQCTPGIDPEALAKRKAEIAAEPTGDFYVGRRYHVHSTRFWGYLRKPRTDWNKAQLVMMNETKGVRVPDRGPEFGADSKHAFDNNYQYKVYGRYTGAKIYDPNSNQILPEFVPTRFELMNSSPGWLFRPNERYDRYKVTLKPY